MSENFESEMPAWEMPAVPPAPPSLASGAPYDQAGPAWEMPAWEMPATPPPPSLGGPPPLPPLGGPPPHPPDPPAAPTYGKRAIAAALALFLAAGAVGAGIERLVVSHGTRPVVTAAASPSTSTPSSSSPSSSSTPSTTAPSSSTPSASGGSGANADLTVGVVDVTTSLGYQNGAAAGTGIVLTSSGEILTNNHVVQGSTSIKVQIGGMGPLYPATLVGTDKTDDLAVIQVVGAPKLQTIKLAPSSTTVSAGDTVTAVGNALGQGQLSIVTGTVQALNQTITASDQGGGNAEQLSGLIETNAPLQPGDSGGPLLNSNGAAIGIDTAASATTRFQSSASVAYAIPIDKALSIAAQIEAGRSSATIHIGLPAFLGVQSLTVADATASGQFTTPVSSGAVVSSAASGTPAESAGLSAGDVIVSLNGTAVTSPTQLGTLIQAHRPGDKVRIGWVDPSGAHHSATVTLIAGPAL